MIQDNTMKAELEQAMAMCEQEDGASRSKALQEWYRKHTEALTSQQPILEVLTVEQNRSNRSKVIENLGSPLYLSMVGQWEKSMKVLLELGEDPLYVNPVTWDGPILFAAREDYSDALDLVLRQVATLSEASFQAVIDGSFVLGSETPMSRLKLLKSHDRKTNLSQQIAINEEGGLSPLQLAAWARENRVNLASVKTILKFGHLLGEQSEELESITLGPRSLLSTDVVLTWLLELDSVGHKQTVIEVVQDELVLAKDQNQVDLQHLAELQTVQAAEGVDKQSRAQKFSLEQKRIAVRSSEKKVADLTEVLHLFFNALKIATDGSFFDRIELGNVRQVTGESYEPMSCLKARAVARLRAFSNGSSSTCNGGYGIVASQAGDESSGIALNLPSIEDAKARKINRQRIVLQRTQQRDDQEKEAKIEQGRLNIQAALENSSYVREDKDVFTDTWADDNMLNSELSVWASADSETRKSSESMKKLISEPIPGLFSFPLLTKEFGERIFTEIERYNNRALELNTELPPAKQLPLPVRHDENFGPLQDVGFESVLTALEKVMRPFVQHYMRDAYHEEIVEKQMQIKVYHAFVTRNAADMNEALEELATYKIHRDKSDLTFNVCLQRSDDMEGSTVGFYRDVDKDLELTNPFSDETVGHDVKEVKRVQGEGGELVNVKRVFTYTHERGQACFHSGKHWHKTDAITKGTRSSLIAWAKWCEADPEELECKER